MGKFSMHICFVFFRTYCVYVCMYVCYYIYLCFKRGLLQRSACTPSPRRAAGKTSRLPLGREDVQRQMCSFSDMSCLFFFFLFSFSLSPPYLRCSIPSSEGWRNVTQKKRRKKKKKLQCGGSIHLDIFLFLSPISISIPIAA